MLSIFSSFFSGGIGIGSDRDGSERLEGIFLFLHRKLVLGLRIGDKIENTTGLLDFGFAVPAIPYSSFVFSSTLHLPTFT